MLRGVGLQFSGVGMLRAWEIGDYLSRKSKSLKRKFVGIKNFKMEPSSDSAAEEAGTSCGDLLFVSCENGPLKFSAEALAKLADLYELAAAFAESSGDEEFDVCLPGDTRMTGERQGKGRRFALVQGDTRTSISWAQYRVIVGDGRKVKKTEKK